MIYFSDFAVASGPVGDLAIGVQSIASGTSNTTVAGTSSNLTGVTPKAALVVAARHAIANDGTETQHAEFSLGIHRTGVDAFFRVQSEDNQASTDNRRYLDNTFCYHSSLGLANTVGRYASGTLASGGLSLSFAGTDLVNRRISYMAFGGNDISAFTNSRAYLGSGIAETPSFEADVVFLLGHNYSSGSIDTGFCNYSIGIGLRDGTQMCVLGSEQNGSAAGAPYQAILTDKIGGQLGTSGATPAYTMTIGSFTSTQYTVTPSVTTGSDVFLHLALNLGGRRTKLQVFTTPTSTGSHSVTGAGFTPQAAIILLTNLEATDPSFPITTSDLMSGFSINLIADNSASHAIRIDSGADPTDTASRSATIALTGANATSCQAILATLTGFTSDGMTLNYTAVQGTAKKGIILFIE